MGAWGVGAFENDDGLDWLLEMEEAPDLAFVEAAFDAVLAEEDDLEDPEGGTAIAAAEMVAAMLGRPPKNLPRSAKAILRKRLKPSAALVVKARQAVERTLHEEDSEIYTLWQDSFDFDAWIATVRDLQGRLEGL